MQKFFIRYHLVGNRVVTETKEYESFGEAVVKTQTGLKRDVIGIVNNGEHVIEMKTKYITYYEVMTESQAKLQSEIASVSNAILSQK